VRRIGQLDWSILLAVALLAAIGVVGIAQANGGFGTLASRQLLWLAVGLLAAMLFVAVDYRLWGEWAALLFAANAGLLIAVLLIGRRVNGSRSWLDLGLFQAQPSELMKVCTVLVLARLLASSRHDTTPLVRLAVVVGVAALPLALVALQPDLGTALTFVGVLAVLVVAAGMRRVVWVAVAVCGLAGAGVLWTAVLKDYQKARIRTFLTPEQDSHGVGYHVIQSRIAIGSGGPVGRGFADGTQSQLDFLPEKDTDFVFSVVAEAWGFVGSLVVLGLYGFLIASGFRIALVARDAFGTYLTLGIMSLLAIHVLVNLGMVMGLLPTIGIPLPLMSYGGSSVVATLIGIGLVLNVSLRRIASR